MGFEVLAAIDLRGGHVVRLQRGAFETANVVGTDPVATAEDLVEQGARWLHIVDLDGARAGEPVHADVIGRIVRTIDGTAWIEVGGGIRDAATATSLLEAGVTRVVLGTAALQEPGLAGTVVNEHGAAALAVAIDVREGRAVGEAWRDGAAGIEAAEAIRRLAAVGVSVFEATAIHRDGTLDGPDLELLGTLVDLDAGQIIASGGIRSIEDLERVRELGCVGAIVGRALYEGSVDIGAAQRRLA